MYLIHNMATEEGTKKQTFLILARGIVNATVITDLPPSFRKKIRESGAEVIKWRTVFPRCVKLRGITTPVLSQYIGESRSLKKGNPVLIFDEIFSSTMIHAVLCKKMLGSRVYIYCFENMPQAFHIRILGKLFGRYIDGALCSCKQTVEQVNKMGVSNTLVCPYPIQEVGRNKVRRVNQINRVGFIGRMVKEKGILELCEAMKRFPEKELLVAGGGILSGKVQRYEVKVLGELPLWNIDVFYSNIDLLVVPSQTTQTWSEQYGRVLLEAMSRGIIVIGSNCGAMPEIISDDRLIFKEKSVASIVEKIRYVSSLPATELSKISDDLRQRYEEKFSNKAFLKIVGDLTGCKTVAVNESPAFQDRI